MKNKTVIFSLLTGLAFSGYGYSEQLTIERIYGSPALDGTAPQNLKVSPDGQRITFIQGKENDYERYDLWEYNIASGKTQLLFDADDLHTGNESLSDEEKARRERMREYGSGIMYYEWSKDGKALLFPLAGDAYYYRIGDEKAKRLLNTPEFETDIQFSPKGHYISYIREQNLYVMDIASGEEFPITKEGGGNIKNGMAEFVAQEEMERMTGYWWSPDESKIAFTRIDETPVEIITRSEIYADSIKMIEQRYPRAGTPNAKVALAIYDLKASKTDWVDMGKEQDIYFARGNWMNDNQHFTYQWQSRDQKTLQLRSFDTKTGKQKQLLEEKSNTWVNLHNGLRFLNSTEQFIWLSEKDGFKHIYLHNNDGSLVKQLTKGDWVVNEIAAVDEASKTLYFTGRVDTPIEEHLYKVGFDGSGLARISQRSGFHKIAFSDDASVYVDDFSTVNTPPQVSLHKADGEQVAWLHENAVTEGHPLYPYMANWIAPEFGKFKTQDGVTLHYRLWKPKEIKGKHPVIVFVYGGPHAQIVTNEWYKQRGLLMQHWVNKGYIVFTVDNRGSNYRGKAFEEPIYERMGEIEVQDQVAGVKFLHTLPYVDKQRIGIYGHSYGGYMALMAMFKAGDYFSAGVSGAPVTDWLLYDTHYTERYMGNPKTNADAYTNSSVFPYAKNLKGKLLIYHGMADDNVLFTHSTRLYKHLQDLSLPFEVMDYPGKKHSIRGKETGIHLYKTITNFFDRNLHPEAH
ncbi:S9 family peptidase [Paraneptunicella aestuarii]|uniref:S9 family peptidase n=1 Tax=Paraneptunicella aestuarii TaxID=2831148 RepID=UPI001E3AF943|nr:S9 family peptidase [Paraneptunicella aestuarii]UAA39585.1 S9 family peptidase [Paraneptunicella aestuarii]